MPGVSDVPTPALVVDLEFVRRNLRRLGTYASAHGLRIRPHTKTHKSIRFASMQMEAGASGLTVAKVGEAEVMAGASGDLLLAYPAVDAARCRRLAELARRVTVRVAIDSDYAADALSAAGEEIGVLVDVDIGYGRTGVQSAEAALALAQHVDRAANLRLDGVMCYPGQVMGSPSEQAGPLSRISERLSEVIELWRRHGLEAEIVSGGSTPTAYQSHLMPELTEIRPGTYAFNDRNTFLSGYCTLEDCAARVVCTVVSDAVPGQVVLDAGSKTLTSDGCVAPGARGHGYVVEYPDAGITKLSEEHGQVDVTGCDARPRIGERVTVIPNHICPCVNLQDVVWVNAGGGGLEAWPVDARGKLS